MGKKGPNLVFEGMSNILREIGDFCCYRNSLAVLEMINDILFLLIPYLQHITFKMEFFRKIILGNNCLIRLSISVHRHQGPIW